MYRLKRPILAALFALTCSGGTPLLAGETVLVVAKEYRFEPAEITVKAGTTVRWENQDKRQYHSVFFEQLGDKPGDYFFPGEFRERTFDQSGTFPYICEPHWKSHGMKGVVIVE
jgi:plastocyanin